MISVRGKKEAVTAIKGGADIIDAEYPFSALGSAYPLNIRAIRQVTPLDKMVSTNIGEKQYRWSTSAQAALGVAVAGADVIKVGLGGLRTFESSFVVMDRVVRNVKYWFPNKAMITTLFADWKEAKSINPVHGAKLAKKAKSAGLLIDTFSKNRDKNLLDYLDYNVLSKIISDCHSSHLKCWLAGSLRYEHLRELWKIGVDVVCVRGAACRGGRERGAEVELSRVKKLVATKPKQR